MNTQEELESLLQEAGKWKELERVRLAFTFGQRDGVEKVVKAVEVGLKEYPCSKNEDEFGGHLTARGHWWGRDESIAAARSVLSDLSKDNK